jgi:hypothetical protein
MPVPPQDQALADTLAVKENPLNAYQVSSGSHSPGQPDALALPINNKWKSGRSLRVKFLNGSERFRRKVRDHARKWCDYANIQFEFVDSADAEVRVNFDSSNNSWSFVGTENLTRPANEPTMNFGWFKENTSDTEFSRTIIHEFGHALGCIHEHQSPAASIPWNKQAVYEYYEDFGWSKEKVDWNIFHKYDGTTTQYSDFDEKSIMLYAIPASLTTNGYNVGWNTTLSQTDKNFISQAYPKTTLDVVNSFNTLEVRQWNRPGKEAVKRQGFSHKYAMSPTLALGLNWLDISNKEDIRVEALADKVNPTSAELRIITWADTTLYSAGCTWFPEAGSDPDFQVGQLNDTSRSNTQKSSSHHISFSRPYSVQPEVIVWLTHFDVARDRDWCIKATATDITTTGFKIHVEAGGETVLRSAKVNWIAYPSNKKGVASGSYSTTDVRPSDKPQLINRGRIDFPPGAFRSIPRVLTAFNSLNISKRSNLRLKLSADSIAESGMNWNIDSWTDTILYSAGASYIAYT